MPNDSKNRRYKREIIILVKSLCNNIPYRVWNKSFINSLSKTYSFLHLPSCKSALTLPCRHSLVKWSPISKQSMPFFLIIMWATLNAKDSHDSILAFIVYILHFRLFFAYVILVGPFFIDILFFMCSGQVLLSRWSILIYLLIGTMQHILNVVSLCSCMLA